MKLQSHPISRLPFVRHDTPIVVGSGFLATLAMTTIMYVLPLMGMAQVDTPLWIVRLVFTDPALVTATALVLHLFVGFGYAWLYANHFEPQLGTGPAHSGLVFGVALWVFAQAIAVPSLGALADALRSSAGTSPGFFSARLGADSAFASLASHLAYGGVLGFVYGCLARGRCLTGAERQ
ncbi:MAG: hypothetical protein HY047_14925 [Acidobacteria bacterium]|nr:hypothetical protein [Acidobacteriota bacterium]